MGRTKNGRGRQRERPQNVRRGREGAAKLQIEQRDFLPAQTLEASGSGVHRAKVAGDHVGGRDENAGGLYRGQ